MRTSRHTRHFVDTEYPMRYYLTSIPNPSDESDFEDTTYETDLSIEKEIRERKEMEQTERTERMFSRRKQCLSYYKRHINESHSIFNCKGLRFKNYSENYISFVFSPNAFSPKYMCDRRKYHMSLRYNKKWWCIKTFEVPNKTEILSIFANCLITDEYLIDTLERIYDHLVKYTIHMIKLRKEKHMKFLNDQEVELYSDEELLFMSPESRKKKKQRLKKIWRGMMSP